VRPSRSPRPAMARGDYSAKLDKTGVTPRNATHTTLREHFARQAVARGMRRAGHDARGFGCIRKGVSHTGYA
jgi:hypothetical protein